MTILSRQIIQFWVIILREPLKTREVRSKLLILDDEETAMGAFGGSLNRLL